MEKDYEKEKLVEEIMIMYDKLVKIRKKKQDVTLAPLSKSNTLKSS